LADQPRIDDLRRRVQKDPASIAFAQLAEELRRDGQFQESVDVCRTGLGIHPGYLSARVTLGRALIELNQLDEGQAELELVLRSTRENLAAIRGLADIHHRRGSLVEALAQYRAALALARTAPDLQRTVAELETAVEPPKPPASAGGMSFEEAQYEFLKNLPPPPPPPPKPIVVQAPVEAPPAPVAEPPLDSPVADPPLESPVADPPLESPVADPPLESPVADARLEAPAADSPLQSIEEPVGLSHGAAIDEPSGAAEPEPMPALDAEPSENVLARARAFSTIAALEHWLDAIHVARTHSRA
jgi:tetratricopeptide (TPR) repeat protein